MPDKANVDDSRKSFNDVLLNISCKNLESHYNRYKDIDAKAIGIITITGILITFLAKPVNNGYLTEIFFTLTMLSFLITIVLTVLVIRTRKYEDVSTDKLIDELSNETKENQINRIIGTIAAAEKKMCEVSNTKAQDLRRSIYSLGVSIVMLIFYSTLSFRWFLFICFFYGISSITYYALENPSVSNDFVVMCCSEYVV
ncbi:MAG: hypothetical protein K8R25_13810 [Methanosarcinales archaeon]|nr:hypothetical protein [Methanosarcinales archaeon]